MVLETHDVGGSVGFVDRYVGDAIGCGPNGCFMRRGRMLRVYVEVDAASDSL